MRNAPGMPWEGIAPGRSLLLTPLLPQVLMCGIPFAILFLGNFFTTLRVVHQKIQNKNQDTKEN